MKMILNKLSDDGEAASEVVGAFQISDAAGYGIQREDQIVFDGWGPQGTAWVVFRKLFVFNAVADEQPVLHLFAADAVADLKRRR